MATRCKGPFWVPHTQGGVTYDLSHLHAHSVTHVFPATPGPAGRVGRPEVEVRVDIHYSHHCFTQDAQKIQRYSVDEIYEDQGRREERIFCVDRWTLSKSLPGIIADLGRRRCYQTRHMNFVTVELEHAKPSFYVVYFRVGPAAGAGVDFFVESAYPVAANPIAAGGYQNATLNKIISLGMRKK